MLLGVARLLLILGLVLAVVVAMVIVGAIIASVILLVRFLLGRTDSVGRGHYRRDNLGRK